MNAVPKARAAATLAQSASADDMPKAVEEFYDRCVVTNYGMTSAQDFDRRGLGIIIAIANEFVGLVKRVDELESLLKEAKKATNGTFSDSETDVAVDAPRRLGRPPGSRNKAPQTATTGV